MNPSLRSLWGSCWNCGMWAGQRQRGHCALDSGRGSPAGEGRWGLAKGSLAPPSGHVSQGGPGPGPQTHGACLAAHGVAGRGPRWTWRGRRPRTQGPGAQARLGALPAPTLGKPPGLGQPWERHSDQTQESTPTPHPPCLLPRTPPGVLGTPVSGLRTWPRGRRQGPAWPRSPGGRWPGRSPARRCPRTLRTPLGRVTSRRHPPRLFSSSRLFWEVDSWISN